MIKTGSQRLFEATRKLAYIHSVNILLPESWTDVEADPVSGLAYEVKVQARNPY
jgi:hypothetical protein